MAMNQKLLRPKASGVWTPKLLSGLLAWYDASKSANVTTVSNAVSQWNDSSGNNYHAVQATANNRPAYTATLNGKNVLTFDGTNDAMTTGVDGQFLTGYMTVFVVATPSSAIADSVHSNKPFLFLRGSTSIGSVMQHDGSTLTVNIQWRGAGFNQPPGPSITTGTPAIFTVAAAPLLRTRRVSGARGNMTYDSATFTAGSGLASAAFFELGQDPTQLRWFNGVMGEVILYSRTLTADEITTVEAKLGAKWGITVV